MNTVIDENDGTRTDDNREVWSIMVSRIGEIVDHSSWHHPSYVQHFSWLRDFTLRPPTLREINDWLAATGWKVTYVDGYVAAATYREMQANATFPVSRFLRPMRQLEHSVAPDFIHDVFGHLPMLFEPQYAALIQEWGSRARLSRPSRVDRTVAKLMDRMEKLRSVEHPDAAAVHRTLEQLKAAQAEATEDCSRFFKFETFYTWAIEFGVVGCDLGSPKLIGAAALSSPGEMANLFNGRTQLRSFVDSAVGHPVDYTDYQPCFFKARSFLDYFQELENI
jgi:phenylalanine-4-hydroxylase